MNRVFRVSLVAASVLFAVHSTAAQSASLDPLLASLPGSSVDRALITFDAAPGSAQISALEAAGLTVSEPFTTLPIVVASGTVDSLLGIGGVAGVRSVYLDRPQVTLLDLTVAKVTDDGAAYAANCAGQPCDGSGVAVAVIDTGVDGTHPDTCMDGLAVQPPLPASDTLCPGAVPAMIQNVEILTDDPMNPVVVTGVANTDETGGHGTHVASIVAGQGTASARFAGVAPGARLVGVSAGEAVAILNTTLAIEWVIQNATAYGIRVINNSWGPPAGTSYDPAHPVVVASSAAADAGLVVVFSAGNSGPGTGTMNWYSANPDVLSVSASDNRAVTPEDIMQGNLIPRDPIESPAGFSAAGVPGSGHLHPDVMAPGQFIIAARATTGFSGAADAATDPVFMSDPNELQYYTTHSGTSMAAPHVSGIAAMVWQAALSTGAVPSAETVREVILNSANPFQNGGVSTVWQEYRAGRGYLDGAAAVSEALTQLSSYSDGVNDAPGAAVVTDVTSFGGGLAEGASVANCPASLGAEDALVPRFNFEVLAGALTMDVMLDWELMAVDLELCLYAPNGSYLSAQRIESDTVNAAVDREHVLSPAAGVYTVEVRGPAGLQGFEGYASVLYPAPPPPPDPDLALAPASANREVGETHVVTATLSDDNGPIAGAEVSWSLSGVGGFVSNDAVTGSDGTAQARVGSADVGVSTITAAVGAVSAQATINWAAAPEPQRMPGASWGSGKLSDGERMNLNVKRETINGPVTGHLKFDGAERFVADNFLVLDVNGNTAEIQAEGRWDGSSGYTATIFVTDGGNPGVDNDDFSVVVKAADGTVVTTAGGVLVSGNLKVE